MFIEHVARYASIYLLTTITINATGSIYLYFYRKERLLGDKLSKIRSEAKTQREEALKLQEEIRNDPYGIFSPYIADDRALVGETHSFFRKVGNQIVSTYSGTAFTIPDKAEVVDINKV